MTMKYNDDKKDDGNDGNGDVTCAFADNDRGEDFQEQIGMPDEENMRHWSHHHSVDTVDDPIFRAAMRGYDTVSFVFGLEVTWSLIQQRQQEEEEKQAMLEIERLEKVDEEETSTNEKHEERDFCSKSDNKSEGDIGDDDDDDDDAIWNLSRVYTSSELESDCAVTCEINGCELRACSLWKSSTGKETNVCLDCQEEEFSGWPNGLEPSDQRQHSLINSLCSKLSTHSPKDPQCIEQPDALTISDNSDDEIDSAEKSKSDSKIIDLCSSQQESTIQSSTTWSCSHCTFQNEDTERKCQMCNHYRSPKKPRI